MKALLMTLACLGLSLPLLAEAQVPLLAAKGVKKKGKKKGKRKKIKETVPVDIGVGPAVFMLFGPFKEDQQLHYGVKLSVKAIIAPEVIKRHRHKIPKKYRKYVSGKNEIRYSPSIFIPDHIIISPKTENTGIYGTSLKPIELSIPLLKKPRLAVGLGVLLTYMFVDADAGGVNAKREDDFRPEQDEAFTMHFFRPGLDLNASLEIPFTDSFLVDFGWSSAFYPPQKINGDFFEWGELDDSIWHVGQAWMRLHFRFPYEASI